MLADAELEGELVTSKAALEEILLSPIIAFAYPYGEHDQRVMTAVARHYRIAFSTREGLNDDDTGWMRLRRSMVSPKESCLEFLMRIALGSNPLSKIRDRVGRWKNAVLSNVRGQKSTT